MSVIGRLDQQVDEVLITPLDKNQRRQAEARDVPSREDTSRAEETKTTNGEQETSDSRKAAEDLPVWLL